MINDVSIKNVNLGDSFLSPYCRLVRDVMIPYQWQVLNDRVEGAEKSHCIENIRIVAGRAEGEFHGFPFQDSDAAKWLEAVAFCLQNGHAAEWEQHADGLIDLIAEAQEEDGYFNTFFQITAPDRKFTNLHEAHELYCLGHFLEAAVAYEAATGKRKVLDIFTRFTDLVDSRFGGDEGKRRGYPGHQEIEIALVKLYNRTGDKRYLNLAKFFLDERGVEPNFFTQEWAERDGLSIWTKRKEPAPRDYRYNQAHKPVREQTEAVGHAVRALYMYTAMAEVGRLSDDKDMMDACKTLFEDVRKQMYITGGVGSTNHGEAFTYAFDLPNEITYSETCASIALIFFVHSLLKDGVRGVYGDVLERALYNIVLSSVGTDGKSYFYVNPMEVLPSASELNPTRRHVKSERQRWHACACCPPNVARLLASVEEYLYAEDADNDTVFVHLYADSDMATELSSGGFCMSVRTRYPLDGKVDVTITKAPKTPMTIALRVPSWCQNAGFTLDGNTVEGVINDGYAYITRLFSEGECLSINLDVQARFVYANTNVRADAGKVCVQRGPLLYCLEQCDNGENLHALLLDTSAAIEETISDIDGMPCVKLTVDAVREHDPDNEVYTTLAKRQEKCTATLVPYHLWGNREHGEMLVWTRKI